MRDTPTHAIMFVSYQSEVIKHYHNGCVNYRNRLVSRLMLLAHLGARRCREFDDASVLGSFKILLAAHSHQVQHQPRAAEVILSREAGLYTPAPQVDKPL